jgi:hypothetical protein
MPAYFVSWEFQAEISDGPHYSSMTERLKERVLCRHLGKLRS